MRFEWDRNKEKRNIKKHAISFDEAVTVFYDPLSATFPDPDHSVEEDRLITIGYSSQERLIVVSHTEREDAIRIISARPATVSERKRHAPNNTPNRTREKVAWRLASR
jgi:uncharacterized DUF497 family protein